MALIEIKWITVTELPPPQTTLFIIGYAVKIQTKNQMEHAQEYNSIVFNLILTSFNGTAIQAQRICPPAGKG